MSTNPKAECIRRASWYLDRIRALQAEMASKPTMDSDDVEQCQAMLREIRARFRADQRVPPAGKILSQIEMSFRNTLALASSSLRIPVGSRPAGRWNVLLNECSGHLKQFAADNAFAGQS